MPDPADDFQLPEDPGERLAWLKNFAEKIPGLAEKLGVSPEQVAQARAMYEEARALQDKVDRALLKLMEAKLYRVPDGWPPPRTLLELMRAIPRIKEPQRQRMLEEVRRWTEAIVLAGSPHEAPKVRGGLFDEGIRLHIALPEPCRWTRIYARQAGQPDWHWQAIVPRDYCMHTAPQPDDEDDERWEGEVEITVLGMLPHADPQVGYSDAWGAPSEVLRLTVPTEYPVPKALWT